MTTATASGVYQLRDEGGDAGGATLTVARVEGDRTRATASTGDENIVTAGAIARLDNQLGGGIAHGGTNSGATRTTDGQRQPEPTTRQPNDATDENRRGTSAQRPVLLEERDGLLST